MLRESWYFLSLSPFSHHSKHDCFCFTVSLSSPPVISDYHTQSFFFILCDLFYWNLICNSLSWTFFWKKFYRKLQKEKLYKQHSPTLSLAVPFVNSLFYLLCHLFSPPSLLFFSPFEVTYIMALYDYYSVLTCSKFFFTKNPCSLDQRNILSKVGFIFAPARSCRLTLKTGFILLSQELFMGIVEIWGPLLKIQEHLSSEYCPHSKPGWDNQAFLPSSFST